MTFLSDVFTMNSPLEWPCAGEFLRESAQIWGVSPAAINASDYICRQAIIIGTALMITIIIIK